MTDNELARLGAHVAEQQDRELGAAEPSESTRRQLAEHTLARTRRQGSEPAASTRWQRPWLKLSLAAAAVLAVFGLKEAVFWNPPLSFKVGPDEESGVLRDWEEAPEDAQLPIRFSDGTLIELEPNARARVVAVGRSGADIVIESGRAHVDVVPVRFRVPGEAAWRVSLGPYSVEVKGTRFDVEWDPRADLFALDLHEGSVSISGCEPGQSHTLVAGQGARASCTAKRWTVASLEELERAENAVPPPASPAPAGAISPDGEASQADEAGADAADAGPAPSSARSTPPRAAGTRPWQRLARDGHFSKAFTAARAAGFERECERVGADDLLLLGDSARLSGDSARAQDAYESVRRRFPGSPGAGRAAFALGRLLVDADPAGARRWFELYLREQPSGALAEPADDWLFELAARGAEGEQLRGVAETYLERHPDGAHAHDAQRILDAARP